MISACVWYVIAEKERLYNDSEWDVGEWNFFMRFFLFDLKHKMENEISFYDYFCIVIVVGTFMHLKRKLQNYYKVFRIIKYIIPDKLCCIKSYNYLTTRSGSLEKIFIIINLMRPWHDFIMLLYHQLCCCSFFNI